MTKFIYPTHESGRFRYLVSEDGRALTTMTTRRKRHTKALERVKQQELIAAIEAVTGKPYVALISRRFDNIERKWRGVKEHHADQ